MRSKLALTLALVCLAIACEKKPTTYEAKSYVAPDGSFAIKAPIAPVVEGSPQVRTYKFWPDEKHPMRPLATVTVQSVPAFLFQKSPDEVMDWYEGGYKSQTAPSVSFQSVALTDPEPGREWDTTERDIRDGRPVPEKIRIWVAHQKVYLLAWDIGSADGAAVAKTFEF